VAPFPAGFEAVNTKLASEIRVAPGRDRYEWAHIELRDDRVTAFTNHLWNNLVTLEYVLRATLPGKFRAAPAVAEAMYSPEIFGRTQISELLVRRAK
jgi:uncharacterized protein YfaS (alpha-2-macroglobulin family)